MHGLAAVAEIITCDGPTRRPSETTFSKTKHVEWSWPSWVCQLSH